ncbi:LysE/ArgO family amino acid transporter [Roseibium suaedae]|uniref:L-lysine exporter family protein LysE/ArgO n=1 Tax=Roseibium suaedae TaxID=735517 RepID=A0A1M7HF16_9HYPH|nr:LysE/ArgO family amino acid transporter [Roseibium suaedae]SHM27034.1 L-lysine exporter family protein LysE/ArgO [Roseibium suaedae]
MTTALSGFLLSLSLIVAIGAQNAFVLRQGLRGEHVFWVCLTCALSDALLITLGVTSLAAISRLLPWIEPVLRIGGAAFLLVYGLRSLRAAIKGGEKLDPNGAAVSSLGSTLLVVLSLTYLNPHVYLDTVLLLGSIASRYPGEEALFAIGAALGSFVFFFTLGYGARLLRPVFARPQAWQVLDVLIAIMMMSLSASLLLAD